ncbi:hypothetical protein [Falsiroseomonas sp. HW251]|uniref:hypothetical protein n=1 Tax=Falsiroseomonas sp. HW251 TaxID=3390998 RepID=UPI003D316A17
MASLDDDLAARLAPRIAALHGANGGDWAATARDALALIRESHRIEPVSAAGAPDDGAETPDTPREDD